MCIGGINMSIESFSKEIVLKTEKEVESFIRIASKSNKGLSINRGLVCNDKIIRGEEKVKEMLQRKINK